ncbi:hypothetical protein [Bacillus phage SPO1L3]|nr:hypothetical protein [Bacillus phage SPO1L3]WIT26691.1 hypothetical protein [Bacillus phage SPO1L5]
MDNTNDPRSMSKAVRLPPRRINKVKWILKTHMVPSP